VIQSKSVVEDQRQSGDRRRGSDNPVVGGEVFDTYREEMRDGGHNGRNICGRGGFGEQKVLRYTEWKRYNNVESC
ncbi:unnamed protein product, partial [Linum tenue]